MSGKRKTRAPRDHRKHARRDARVAVNENATTTALVNERYSLWQLREYVDLVVVLKAEHQVLELVRKVRLRILWMVNTRACQGRQHKKHGGSDTCRTHLHTNIQDVSNAQLLQMSRVTRRQHAANRMDGGHCDSHSTRKHRAGKDVLPNVEPWFDPLHYRGCVRAVDGQLGFVEQWRVGVRLLLWPTALCGHLHTHNASMTAQQRDRAHRNDAKCSTQHKTQTSWVKLATPPQGLVDSPQTLADANTQSNRQRSRKNPSTKQPASW